MAPIPTYQYAIATGLNNTGGLVNVELLTAGGKYFAPPSLDDDDVLLQKLTSGEDFERGFHTVTWLNKVWRGQYGYVYSTILGGAYSGPVTIRTRRVWSDSTFYVYDGYLRIPTLKPLQRNYTLFQLAWTFTRLRLIA